MTRREFPTKIRVAVIKRATVGNVVYCEKCGCLAKRFQIDHIIADSHGGEPVLENAMLICEQCYSEKNARDTTVAAKIKRVEARHIGAVEKKQKIVSRGFQKRERQPKPRLPPRKIYMEL